MSGPDTISPTLYPSKRKRGTPIGESPPALPLGGGAPSPQSDLNLQDGSGGGGGGGGSAHGGTGKAGQSSNFRNVSACNRCRLRKNRCDQKLPSCASCEKANVACVGYDPITKREIPRSYVFYLETRVEQLEALLQANNIAFPPAENLEYCSKAGNETAVARSPTDGLSSSHLDGSEASSHTMVTQNGDDTSKLQRLVSKTGMAGVPEASNPRYLGSASGISFAKVVFAAVQMSVSDQKSISEKSNIRPSRPLPFGSGSSGVAPTSMRDSFFGLHGKPTIHPAPFPDKSVGQKMVTLYFEHANPQIPVLHKVNFMQMFEQAYAEEGRVRGPKELYMLNMVFAIGSGTILGDVARSDAQTGRPPGVVKQSQPEEYHASAIVNLESCLTNSGGGLEELQAVLLLANFALLRPVPPGLWYIIGVAVRLAVDLGLHYEDGKDLDTGLGDTSRQQNEDNTKERGRREYVRDMRRRLWWCTYSLDRLVSVCVGRPFGISDQVITTEFPSLLEDRYITPMGFTEPASDVPEPTYKLVAHHYFRLRLLQSEILQVLQYQQAQIARAGLLSEGNQYMHTSLPSPFLSRFDSFRSWRIDIDRRLYEWKKSAPTRHQTGVAFSIDFLDLNYWQAIIMLYRQSLSVPALFEGEYHTSKEVNSPSFYSMELREDEDRVYLKVAEAGQKILRLYRQLHVKGVVNYTYLATHHLFMAGISYLYAIWHSPIVRSRLHMDEVDFTILAATSVFTDLSEKCPPAEACRDAFDRTAKATIKMANSTGGFGQSLPSKSGPSARSGIDYFSDYGSSKSSSASSHVPRHRQKTSTERLARPQFDIASDTYSTSGSSVSQLSALHSPFRLAGAPSVSTSDTDGFSLMRAPPTALRSNASSSDAAATPDASAIDPSLMPSPTLAGPVGSPIRGSISSQLSPRGLFAAPAPPQQQQQQQHEAAVFNPADGLDFGDLQGIDFGNFNGPALSGADAGQMDLGFGLGWEGLHHDFSDGQQVDLFDGFFFGGQQGGAGSNGMGM